MKLTVVIPVYHVESTLQRCVQSVLGQQVDDMEVILVDDGSPDRCPQLCDEWQAKDHRIRVIHKPNGGLSDARNAGIGVATGEFITFVDSDDYLAPDTYPALLTLIGDADIVEYSMAERLTLSNATYHDMGQYWLSAKAYAHTYACNKIYRRALFADSVRYPVGRLFEDAYMLPLLLRKAHKVITTSRGTYHYCYNEQGITATADGQALSQLLEAHIGNQMPMDDEYYMHLLNIQMDVWELTGSPLMLPMRHVNSSHLHGTLKLKAIALNTIGINNLCRINKAIHHIHKPNRS